MAISENLQALATAEFEMDAAKQAAKRRKWNASPEGMATKHRIQQSGIDHIRTCLQHAGNNPD